MIHVEQAEKIIQSQLRNFGTETIPFELSLGRVLAEEIKADRDFPPFNRPTVDGIAIRYEAFSKGARTFKIKATQAAGETPLNIDEENDCIEIMTGAALHDELDTVIRYEDIDIKNGAAEIKIETVTKGQNIHIKGKDKKQGDVVAATNQIITPALISIAASVGKTMLSVKKLPRIIIISSGDELVEVDKTPSPYQIRRSNNYTIKALLQTHGVNADMVHIPDEPGITKKEISKALQNHDVIIISGGVSMGKFDYVPQALEALSVKELFHKVQQRPGKPLWFGVHTNGVPVFAFPGNPVSAFMCMVRYFFPWLEASLGLTSKQRLRAALNVDFSFTPALQYFLQVKLSMSDTAQLLATPITGNGSGDFANLIEADAFIELPMEKNNFMRGEVYRVWPFKRLL